MPGPFFDIITVLGKYLLYFFFKWLLKVIANWFHLRQLYLLVLFSIRCFMWLFFFHFCEPPDMQKGGILIHSIDAATYTMYLIDFKMWEVAIWGSQNASQGVSME